MFARVLVAARNQTCRDVQDGPKTADIENAVSGKRPPKGGLSLSEKSFPSDLNLDGNIGAYPIRLPGL